VIGRCTASANCPGEGGAARKLREAGRKAALTRKRSVAGTKAAITKKRSAAGKKAAVTY